MSKSSGVVYSKLGKQVTALSNGGNEDGNDGYYNGNFEEGEGAFGICFHVGWRGLALEVRIDPETSSG